MSPYILLVAVAAVSILILAGYERKGVPFYGARTSFWAYLALAALALCPMVQLLVPLLVAEYFRREGGFRKIRKWEESL